MVPIWGQSTITHLLNIYSNCTLQTENKKEKRERDKDEEESGEE